MYRLMGSTTWVAALFSCLLVPGLCRAESLVLRTERIEVKVGGQPALNPAQVQVILEMVNELKGRADRRIVVIGTHSSHPFRGYKGASGDAMNAALAMSRGARVIVSLLEAGQVPPIDLQAVARFAGRITQVALPSETQERKPYVDLFLVEDQDLQVFVTQKVTEVLENTGTGRALDLSLGVVNRQIGTLTEEDIVNLRAAVESKRSTPGTKLLLWAFDSQPACRLLARFPELNLGEEALLIPFETKADPSNLPLTFQLVKGAGDWGSPQPWQCEGPALEANFRAGRGLLDIDPALLAALIDRMNRDPSFGVLVYETSPMGQASLTDADLRKFLEDFGVPEAYLGRFRLDGRRAMEPGSPAYLSFYGASGLIVPAAVDKAQKKSFPVSAVVGVGIGAQGGYGSHNEGGEDGVEPFVPLKIGGRWQRWEAFVNFQLPVLASEGGSVRFSGVGALFDLGKDICVRAAFVDNVFRKTGEDPRVAADLLYEERYKAWGAGLEWRLPVGKYGEFAFWGEYLIDGERTFEVTRWANEDVWRRTEESGGGWEAGVMFQCVLPSRKR